MKIFYSYKAIGDLKRLHHFIAKNNSVAATEVSQRILQAISRLTEFPFLGKQVKTNKTTTSLRDLVTGKYLIRYAILKEEIHILRIWHGKENWSG